jgi:hypothetical protein
VRPQRHAGYGEGTGDRDVAEIHGEGGREREGKGRRV